MKYWAGGPNIPLQLACSTSLTGGAGGPPFQNCFFYLIQHENIIQGCLISFIIIQVHKIILQVPLPHGLPLYIALIPQSKALYY